MNLHEIRSKRAKRYEEYLGDNYTEAEGRRFWTGYEEFLDRISTVGDDERTICMEVLAA